MCVRITYFPPQIFTATKTFKKSFKVGNKFKTTTCNFKINYSGDNATEDGSSVSCSYAGEKKKDVVTSKPETFLTVPLGDVTGTLFKAEVKFTFSKKKNKNSKTSLTSVVTLPYAGMLSALIAENIVKSQVMLQLEQQHCGAQQRTLSFTGLVHTTLS